MNSRPGVNVRWHVDECAAQEVLKMTINYYTVVTYYDRPYHPLLTILSGVIVTLFSFTFVWSMGRHIGRCTTTTETAQIN